MMELNGRMTKDTLLYMIAKSIEGIVGILTISCLSYIFKTEQVDIYVLVNISATTLAMLAIQWLAQSSGRYLNDYELNDDRTTFYSTVFFAWLRVNVVIVLCLIPARLLLQNIGSGLYALAAAYFVTYNTSQLLITLLSVKRKAVTNLLISVFSSVGKLGLIYLFAIVLGPKVEIIFLSYILCDLTVIAVGCATLTIAKYVDSKKRSAKLLKSFGKYGAPLVGNLATTTVLNNSDRFVMKYYLPKGAVGVYSMSYTVVSSAFTMLMSALMRGSYPTILKTYATGDKELTERLVSQAVRNYLLLAIPAVAGIGAVAKPMAELLFEESYVGGYTVMIWVALGMMFLGLAEYSNKPWELSAQTQYIFGFSLIGGIVNIALNIVFIPRFGYMTAAYSTFLGFFTYFCLSRLNSRKLMKWHIKAATYVSIIGSAVIMCLFILSLMTVFGSSRKMLFVYIALGIIVYAAALAVTGEIKEEIKAGSLYFKNKKNRRKNRRKK